MVIAISTQKNETRHTYYRADGMLHHTVHRRDTPDGKRIFREPAGAEGAYLILGAGGPDGGLDRATPETTVYIVEGEKCVDSLMAIGLTATTSGSSSSAHVAEWSPLRRFRNIVILPDNDEPGERYAADVVDILSSLPGARSVSLCCLPGLSESGDVADYLERHSLDELMAAIAEHSTPVEAPVIEALDSKPIPLCRVDQQEPFPMEALGKILFPAAELLAHEAVQVPESMAAASLLTAASIAVQPHVDIFIDGRSSPTSLFLITIAESGDRKSAVDYWAMKPVHDRQQEMMADYEVAFRQYKADKRRFDKARKKDGYDVEEPIEPPVPILMAGDFTVEAIRNMLGRGLPSIGLVSDEGGSIINGHSLREAYLRSLAEYSSFWDGRGRIVIRATTGAHSLYGTRVALHMMLQPIAAAVLTGDETAHQQGFLGRCLTSWPASIRGTRMYKQYNPKDSESYRLYCDRMEELLHTPWPMSISERSRGLAPKHMHLTPRAHTEYVRFYNHTESAMDDFKDVSAFACKVAEHALRIAGVLAHFESGTLQVDLEAMRHGILIAEWFLLEAKRIRRQGINYEAMAAQRLLDWLHETGKDTVTATDVLTLGPTEFRTAAALHQAMEVLELHRCVTKKPDVRGHQWKVNQ